MLSFMVAFLFSCHLSELLGGHLSFIIPSGPILYFSFLQCLLYGAGCLHLAVLRALGVWVTLRGILTNSYYSQAGVFSRGMALVHLSV